MNNFPLHWLKFSHITVNVSHRWR